MTLLKVDGFDAYTTISQRWNSASVGTPNTVTIRTGRASLYSPELRQIFAPADAHHTMIIGSGWYRGTQGDPNVEIAVLGDNGTTTHVTLNISANGAATVRRGTGSGTILHTFAVGTFPSNAWFYIEMKVRVSDTIGTVEIRLNGNPTPILALTAQDTKNAGTNTTLDTVYFRHYGTGTPQIFLDDVYICNGAGTVNNDFLGECEVITLLPVADGPSVQFAPSTGSDHYALVDEVPPNTTDYNTGSTDGQRELYQFTTLSTTTGVIKGIASNVFAAKSGTGPKFIRDTVRISATDYDDASVALATGYLNYTKLREVSPATSAAFTVAEINAARFGVVAKDT